MLLRHLTFPMGIDKGPYYLNKCQSAFLVNMKIFPLKCLTLFPSGFIYVILSNPSLKHQCCFFSQTPAAGEDGLHHRESCSSVSSLQTAGWRHFPAHWWQRRRTGRDGIKREAEHLIMLLLYTKLDEQYAWVLLSFNLFFPVGYLYYWLKDNIGEEFFFSHNWIMWRCKQLLWRRFLNAN